MRLAPLVLLLVTRAATADCLAPQWERLSSPAGTGQLRHSLATADFDADGKLDAVIIDNDTGPATDRVLLLRGKGDGTFAAPQTIHQAAELYEAVAKDLNGDAKVDLLLEDEFALVFLPGRGDGTFGAPVISPTPEGTRIAVADWTGDGIADVALLGYTESGPDPLIILGGDGQGSFVEARRQTLAGNAAAIAAGDLDADGRVDLVVSYFASAVVELFFGRGDGTFDSPVPIQSGTFAFSFTIADAEGDGDLDIVAPHWDDDTVAVHRNLGGRSFSSALYSFDTDSEFPNNPNSASFADVTGDGISDLVVAAVNGQLIGTLRGHGDGTFAPAAFKNAFSLPTSVATADLDGDGRVDVFMGNRFGGFMVILRNRCGDVGEVRFTALTPTIEPGQSATFRVEVFGYSVFSSAIQPTGEVSIVRGNTVLATAPLISGAASVTIPGLAPGSHALVARYTGDAQYEPAHSQIIVQRVGASPPRRRAARH